ncbi:MAG: hypothetical protein CMC97_05260, partial [Flavobacteriales bacterium]|nr:hypothetical protein [Flavobacteriales bacterium]
MPNAFFQVPYPENEPVLSYSPGSPEREAQLAEYERMLNQDPVSVPMVIGGRQVTTDDRRPLTPPHDHQRVIGHAHFGTADHVREAIDAALEARTGWAALDWEQRASIFEDVALFLVANVAYPWPVLHGCVLVYQNPFTRIATVTREEDLLDLDPTPIDCIHVDGAIRL